MEDKGLKETEVTIYDNLISNIITITGWVVIVVGLIIGLIVASDEGFLVGFPIFGSSIVSGIMLLGLAEVIKLLDILNQKIK